MDIEWKAHRFSGGMLAFDFVNTVIYRDDPERCEDRLNHINQIDKFAAAAAEFNSDEIGDTLVFRKHSAAEFEQLLTLRECTDRFFRSRVRKMDRAIFGLSDLLLSVGEAIRSEDRSSFQVQVALSVLRLLDEGHVSKARICPNCHWLIFDKSKNGSRVWCDMAVCGNRHKARLNYQRQRGITEREKLNT